MDYDEEPYVEPQLVSEWRKIAEKYKDERNALVEKVFALEAQIQAEKVSDKKLSESMLRQISATVDEDGYPVGSYPDYPIIPAAKAVQLLEAETHWIRSANLEYYYRYAVIEDAETEERFVVNRWTEKEQWFIVLKWLCDTDDYIEVILKEEDDVR